MRLRAEQARPLEKPMSLSIRPTGATVIVEGHVASITLDSGEGLNLLDAALRDDLATAVESVADDGDVRVVIVTGADGVFASGVEPIPDEPAPPGAGRAIAALRKPTVAWIDGECLDMGLELALACDIRFASPTSTFGLRGVQQGVLPWDGGTQRLARAVGRGHALRLLLTGEVVGAEEALHIGLIQGVGDAQMAAGWAVRAAAGAPIASAYTKEAVTSAGDLTLGQGLRLEVDLSVLLQSTADRTEGLTAFKAKRKREFEGR
jgi:enoyl-CoA hydratase/carnithine racemase